MINLSDIRWDRALRRLRKRQRDAEHIFEVYDDYEAMQHLKFQAMEDYLEEVPELRALRKAARKENAKRGIWP